MLFTLSKCLLIKHQPVYSTAMNVLLLMTVITVGSWGVGHARCPSLTNFSASNRCARFYEHSSCRGRFLQVNKGEEAGTLPPGWDNRASSVLVARGCRLIIYLHTNFRVSLYYCMLYEHSNLTEIFSMPIASE